MRHHAVNSTCSRRLALGMVAARALYQVVGSLLFQPSATDPGTFLAVRFLLLLAAAVACWLPARRAARVDPLTALRAE